MIINIYITKAREDEVNLHFLENFDEITEETTITQEPEPEPTVIHEPEPSKPYPIGSPEAQAAIERVKNKMSEYEPPKKRGRRKKEDNE